MASLLMTVALCFLLIEGGLITLLLLPFISARRWSSIFKSQALCWIENKLTIPFYVIVAMLSFIFLDGFRVYRQIVEQKDEIVMSIANTQTLEHMHVRMFRAQRDLYISGGALFLMFVLAKLTALISKLAQEEAKAEASMKQAKSASQAAMSSMTSNNENENNEIKEYKEEIADLKRKLSQKDKDLAAMKKQAEGTAKEFDRVAAELQNKAGSSSKKDD